MTHLPRPTKPQGSSGSYLARGITAAGQALSEGIHELAALLGDGVKHAQLWVVEAEAWVCYCIPRLPQASHQKCVPTYTHHTPNAYSATAQEMIGQTGVFVCFLY